MVGEERFYGCGLVVGEREDVREAAAGVDDGFAGFFGGNNGGAWANLRGADGGDVRTGGGKGGIEHALIGVSLNRYDIEAWYNSQNRQCCTIHRRRYTRHHCRLRHNPQNCKVLSCHWKVSSISIYPEFRGGVSPRRFDAQVGVLRSFEL